MPYATYRWAEYKAMKADDQIKRETGEKASEHHASRMDKEYLLPKYEASVGSDFEDGLFDGVLLPPSSLSKTPKSDRLKLPLHLLHDVSDPNIELRVATCVLCADFLELAVQFGMVTMFASAYPFVAAFAFLVHALSLPSIMC